MEEKGRKQMSKGKGYHPAKDELKKIEASKVRWILLNMIGKKSEYLIRFELGAMLKEISREDLTELYRIVMKRYGTKGPTNDYERVFWENLKTMFDEPLSTDLV
ncbi:hypothetical protein Tco_0555611 [Tanacetum coccineum]